MSGESVRHGQFGETTPWYASDAAARNEVSAVFHLW
jgi:hypothetical protein